MVVNIVVLFALVLGIGLFGLWFFSLEIRARIEQPKYDFLNKVRVVDAAQKPHTEKTNEVKHDA